MDSECDLELMRPSWVRPRSSTPSTVSVSGSDEQEASVKKFVLHATYCYVTWSQSRIDDHEEFYCKLRARMPHGTEIFGGKELHEDGFPHYHVVMKFPRRIHWRDARKKFVLERSDGVVDTEAIRIVVPDLYQPVSEFLDHTQAYCAKDDNPWMFGERIEGVSTAKALRKRVFAEIVNEPDYDRASKMIKEYDPYEYVMRYISIQRFLETRRRVPAVRAVEALSFEPSPWRLPPEVEEWKRQNIDDPSPGRKRPLVLIGPSRTGKTKWAESFGKPFSMSKRWNMASYCADATHVVVNDVDARSFGVSGESYWREVLGCQEEFDASDRYAKTERLLWNFACVWTCNPDQDPRRYSEVADYLKDTGAVVVELTAKLYVDSSLVQQGDATGGSMGAQPPESTRGGERVAKRRRMVGRRRW